MKTIYEIIASTTMVTKDSGPKQNDAAKICDCVSKRIGTVSELSGIVSGPSDISCKRNDSFSKKTDRVLYPSGCRTIRQLHNEKLTAILNEVVTKLKI